MSKNTVYNFGEYIDENYDTSETLESIESIKELYEFEIISSKQLKPGNKQVEPSNNQVYNNNYN